MLLFEAHSSLEDVPWRMGIPRRFPIWSHCLRIIFCSLWNVCVVPILHQNLNKYRPPSSRSLSLRISWGSSGVSFCSDYSTVYLFLQEIFVRKQGDRDRETAGSRKRSAYDEYALPGYYFSLYQIMKIRAVYVCTAKSSPEN